MTNPLLIYILTAAYLIAVQPSHELKQTVELERYVNWYFDKQSEKYKYMNFEKRRLRTIAMIPMIVEESNKSGIDPTLTIVVMKYESSFRPGIIAILPNKGEGLMQAHGVAAKGFDMSTVRGQVQAGVRCLAYFRDTCKGHLLNTLTAYQTGKCRPIIKSARWRYRAYLRAIERFGIDKQTKEREE
jgi:soluble lytic murein transglycosylase-like protein